MLLALLAYALPAAGVPVADRPVEIESTLDGTTLGCTWTTPSSPTPDSAWPAAVLLSVAGPNDRDQTVGPHRLFADLARGLADAGIASLRCDDHGVGDSTGDWLQASYEVRAADAVRMASWIRAQDGVDPERVGFVGNSEGGAVGPLATLAMTEEPAAFVVLLAGPGVPAQQALRHGLEAAIEQRGLPDATATRFRALFDQLVELMNDAKSAGPEAGAEAALRKRMTEFLQSGGAMLIPAYGFVPPTIEGLTDLLLSPWYRSQFRYEPTKALAAVGVPLLALTGSKDTVLPADPHLHGVRAARAASGQRTVVRELEGLNHVFQEAETGSPIEYPTLPGGFAPRAIELVVKFIMEGGSN